MSKTYYRTAYGSHRHESYYCANSKRAIASGDPIEIAADDVANWAPCSDCTENFEVAQGAYAALATTPSKCSNSGVTEPRKIYSKCRDCGKEGKVNRSTGSIRAHAPQN